VDTLADEVMQALVALAPGVGVGLCLNDEISQGQVLRRHVPADWEAASGRSPTRLFPELNEERVINIDRLGNSTLHLAGAALPDDGDRVWTVMEYVRRSIEQALARRSDVERTRRDTTELRRLQAQVIQAEKLASLGQIAAGIVHELNNPLTSIIAYSEFLRRNAATREDADALERLGRIQEGAERILKFSRDLVSYARPATDVPGPVHLGEVLDKALVFCEHEFAERHVVAKLNGTRPTILVRGVAGQLTQVFVNLLTNAAHAMRNSGGALELAWSVAADGSQAIVEVVDLGEGIPAQDLERIFDPFFTTKAPGEGTGLGLSIVRSILEAHGGSMSAHPNQDGPGTTFRVVLPVVERPPSRPPLI
jgi:C4-dicarboxylate-specific signal transduction histidine kinase